MSLIMIFLFICIPHLTESAKILGIFPLITAPSHFVFGNALLKGLVQAGHEVTVISPHEDINAPDTPAYRKIVVQEFLGRCESTIKVLNVFEISEKQIFEQILRTGEEIFSHANIRKLITSGEKFDVVIVDNYKSEFLKIFAYLFEAHLVVLNSGGISSMINGLSGFDLLPYKYPSRRHILKNISYFDEIGNLFYYVTDIITTYYWYIPRQNKILKKYFPNSTHVMNMVKNVSLVFSNFHPSLGGPVQTAPNLIHIGGIHLQPPGKLPQDLQEFLDSAEEGVVYFSMGSLMKSKYLPEDKRKCLIKAFSKLKQKVLWKWEDDILPDQPPNVRIQKWLPQQDVLAHPNVKVFVMHGGMLSLTEAVYHGVPILVIPVISDQFSHAYRAELNGYGLSLAFENDTFSEKKLLALINELLVNPKYKTNIMARSKLFRDRPIKPMESAVYWVEYIIRHNGAPHLKQADGDIQWINYLIFEIILIIINMVLLILFVLYMTIRKVLLFKKEKNSKIQNIRKQKST